MSKKVTLETEKAEKKIALGAIILTVASVVLLVTLITFGLRVKFMIQDELDIQLTPLSLSVEGRTNEIIPVSFSVHNNNFVQCQAECRFSLTDLGSGAIIHSKNATLDHGETLIINMTLTKEEKGSGQRLYSFMARCSNQKTVICPTGGEERVKTALITKTFLLTDEERGIKEAAATVIADAMRKGDEAYLAVSQAKTLVDRLPRSGTKDLLSAQASRIALDPYLSKVDGMVRLWNSQDYLALGEMLEVDLDHAPIMDEAQGLLALSLSAIDDRERSVLAIRSLDLQSLGQALSFYREEPSIENIRHIVKIEDSSNELLPVIGFYESGGEMTELSALSLSLGALSSINRSIDEFRDLETESETLLSAGKRLLEAKNVSPRINGSMCDGLRTLSGKIDEANANSSSMRASIYSWMSDNKTALSALENISAAMLKQAVAGDIPDPVPVLNLTGEEVAAIVLIRFPDLERFLVRSCSDDTLEGVRMVSSSGLAGLDLSWLDGTIPSKDLPEMPPRAMVPKNDNNDICCSLRSCGPCDVERSTPILFIHGHSFNEKNTPMNSMVAFSKIQERLVSDGIINAGEFDTTSRSFTPGEWGRCGKPISVRATYYYITHHSLGNFEVTSQKSERIENYALRLQETIDLLLSRTGSDKVTIVAHSMGGLVAREYLTLFGESKVERLITINTPHLGVTDRVASFCSVLGSNKECDDLTKGSVFLQRLDLAPIPQIPIYVIYSDGCEMGESTGDGVVAVENALFKGARASYMINGTCTDALNSDLHGNVLDPDKYPGLYMILKEIIQ